MARLNEPPVPADGHLELLRRKFLRQNRDIAKINSDQSQKIRRLENDIARLLSENLDLRGQILRLEKQVEDNTARRIADHALEVRAKLEVQLSEFASLLGSLGVEPPAKRRSSDERAFEKGRKSTRSPAQRRRRNTEVDPETLAEQEGRLPPIYENKSYPRATMNSAEIMALCAAAEDENGSPDLGPPPVSRFVEEDPVNYNSPTNTAMEIIPESPRLPPMLSSPPLLDYDRKPLGSPEPKKDLEEITVKDATSSRERDSAKQPAPSSQTVRAGSKRKYGDENETITAGTAGTGKENATICETEKPFPSHGNQKRRSIREAPANRRERVGPARTPLAAKSTNADVSSPRKAMTATAGGLKKEQAQGPRARSSTKEASTRRPLPKVEIPPPELPAVVTVTLEPETALLSAMPSSPATPERPARTEVPHDTPPPADISFNGETSRPSRRARSAVSYAEPNLRDKMRRPTKELLDAVTGEGKFAHRLSTTKLDDHHSAPTSTTKARSEPGNSTSSSKSSSKTVLSEQTKAQHHASLSPLAQKDVFTDTLPNTVVTERRKRPSAVGTSRESLAASDGPEDTSGEPSPAVAAHTPATAQPGSDKSKNGTTATKKSSSDDTQQQPAPTSKPTVDIYDFASFSPPSEPKPAAPCSTSTSSSSSNSTGSRSRTTRKSSMAAAAALRELLDEEEQEQQDTRPALPSRSRASNSRKRASMMAPKKISMVEEEVVAEEVGNVSGVSGTSDDVSEAEGGGRGGGRDRISRRRSMML